ncbi:hypothetical protein [Variovorax sp. IB41]|jgi:hypothetical protein|uniref:hypothetical protein n=1 Tax=Variovorax sp. IB41 TaxID=2779370 RepID=UPI0018E802FB|nr:hypothetical protein [Variovorax sp. IB41]MBJ2155227.1 hypothetical protein [Variovorax sp. IB41]
MDATPLAIDLPAHWTGSFVLTRTGGGSYVGMASLSSGGVPRGVLVITQQLTWDAAIARVKLRVGHFIQEWDLRPRS